MGQHLSKAAPKKHPYEMMAGKIAQDEQSEDERLAIINERKIPLLA